MVDKSRKNNAKLGLVGKHLVFEIEENQMQAEAQQILSKLFRSLI